MKKIKVNCIVISLFTVLVAPAYAQTENFGNPSFFEQNNQSMLKDKKESKPQLQNSIKKSQDFISEDTIIPLSGALADSLTTAIAIGKDGLTESNGLINTSPLGLTALFAVKTGMVYYANSQPERIRKPVLKMTAGLWSGVSMNNLLLILGTSNPVSIVGGIAFGIYMYHKESQILENK